MTEVFCSITFVRSTVSEAEQLPQHVGSSCKTETADAAAMLISEELHRLPESLLQLTSQRRKPRNVTAAALSQAGELLSILELNESALGSDPSAFSSVPFRMRHQKEARYSGLPELLPHKVSRGVSATGDLIQSSEEIASGNDTVMMLQPKAAVPKIDPITSPIPTLSLWHRISQWPAFSLLQACTTGDSFTEGLLIFCLVNIFCCAIMTGFWFIYSARKGVNEGGLLDEDEESEEPPIRVPKGDHTYNYSIRQAQDSSISGMGGRQQKPAAIGAWNPTMVSSMPQPAQSHQPPRQSETPGSSRRHLCPELVVPRGSECVLAVRCLVSARLQQVEFDILDVNGKPVLRVEVSPQFASHSRPWPSQLQRSPTVTLKSLNPRESTGGFVLCYCCNVTKEDEGSSSKRNVYIYKDDDELFAHLMKDDIRKRYVLTSGRLGLQLLFEGNFEEHAVDISNESRELLAATEPGVMDFDPINKYYKLRVAADVDVGLVLSGLLAIDQMEVP